VDNVPKVGLVIDGDLTPTGMTSSWVAKGRLEKRKTLTGDASRWTKKNLRESCSFSIYVGGERKARREKKEKSKKSFD
jgi:hypothetical protein